MKTIRLGRIEYTACWKMQNELASARSRGEIDDTLLLLEHPPTITLGRSAKSNHLVTSVDELENAGVALVEVDRGGDITYHGPGQLVGYPIFDLRSHGQDLHLFLRKIEQALIETIGQFGLHGRRFPPHTGVWVGDEKIAAIGIKVSKWISTHGFALNVNPDMSHFSHIIPCGIVDYGVTSMECLLDPCPTLSEVSDAASDCFAFAFATEIRQTADYIPS